MIQRKLNEDDETVDRIDGFAAIPDTVVLRL